MNYAAGQCVFRTGDPGEDMFVVLSGQIEIRSADGRALTRLGPGEAFGEIAIVDNGPRSADAWAVEDGTRLLPIDRARFVYLVSQQPAFALAVMASMSRRLRAVMPEPAADDRVAWSAKSRADWEVVQIIDGVYQLRSPGRAANAYLLAGRERTVLVDAGLPSTVQGLSEAMRRAGRPPESIDLLILTHEHFDHVGGASGLPARAIRAAHSLAASKIALGDDFAMVSHAFGEPTARFDVNLMLAEGSTIQVDPFRLEVLHTPGHSSGCICLYDAERSVLISGDTVMSGGLMGGIFASGNISDYVRSLERLGRLDVRYLLPGHGRCSANARHDVAMAAGRARALLDDTRSLFETLAPSGVGFDHIMRSVRDLNL